MNYIVFLMVFGIQLNFCYGKKHSKHSYATLQLKDNGEYEYHLSAWTHWFFNSINGGWSLKEDTLILKEQTYYHEIVKIQYEQIDDLDGLRIDFEEVNSRKMNSLYVGIDFDYTKIKNLPKWKIFKNLEKGSFIINSDNTKGIQVTVEIDEKWLDGDSYIDEGYNYLRLYIDSTPEEKTEIIEHKYLVEKNKLTYLEGGSRGIILPGIMKKKKCR